ncbi:MAG: DJ-1/PfpI family protein [Planctomycetota bacterium]
MKHISLVLFIIAIFVNGLYAQEETPKTGGPFPVKLEKPSSEYYLYVPDGYAHDKSWPLLIALHGAGDTARNFIGAWTGNASKYGYIVLAVKSAAQGWVKSDGPLILSAIEDVKKQYLINHDLVFIAGFSSGAFMVSEFGMDNYKLFRIIATFAGATFMSAPQPAKDRISIFIICGAQDLNMISSKQGLTVLKSGNMDVELKEVPNLGHAMRNEDIDWLCERIEEKTQSLKDLMRRAKLARNEKRYRDAISACNGIVAKESDADTKALEQAQKDAKKSLADMEKLAQDSMKKAKEFVKNGKTKDAKRLLLQISKDFAGLALVQEAVQEIKTLPKSVLMIIASKNFRDEELFTPKEIFEKASLNVTIASSSLNEAKGIPGKTVKPQMLIRDVNVEDWDIIVFVGGIGAKEYYDDKVAHKIATETVKQNKVLGAICLAPGILANAGILKDKNATVWKDEKDLMVKQGANYSEKDVEVDGKIITASGPAFSAEFAEQILKVFKGTE